MEGTEDMAKKSDGAEAEEQDMVEAPEAEVAEAQLPETAEQAPEPEPEPEPEPTPEAVAEAKAAIEPGLLVWFPLIPQDTPFTEEAWASEHEWQLEHNPSYQGQFEKFPGK
jgi:hypothetical protein